MKNKAYTYENVQIGDFLVSLGYHLGQKGYSCPFSINLFQQTPDDKTIGDLFGGIDQKYFIIEFKRDGKNRKTELEKASRKKFINELEHRQTELKKTSLQGHFLCYPEDTQEENRKEIKFCFTSYISLVPQLSHTAKKYHMADFISNLFIHESLGVNYDQIKPYLQLLAKCAGDEDPDAGGVSGIMMSYDKNKGITYAPFDSLKFLEQKMSLKKSPLPEYKRSKTRSYGMSM